MIDYDSVLNYLHKIYLFIQTIKIYTHYKSLGVQKRNN